MVLQKNCFNLKMTVDQNLENQPKIILKHFRASQKKKVPSLKLFTGRRQRGLVSIIDKLVYNHVYC